MKNICMILLSLGLLSFAGEAQAQQQKVTKGSPRVQQPVRATDSVYYFRKHTTTRHAGRSINDATIGVMGQDTLRANQKGRNRNLNYNKGMDLPPNTGGLK